ncbi:hypothetical protein M427DRAFT_366081 [Gonapodya prolifera JEL478]|uniref:Uncharacterized protein n=1 Tax=Gonapodya prolifera (strain JEL478) TaxID=1344416 RepID=A0A139AA94_GONPJ|nr:hypothetical protein M427DRAFT_366081 [Gonapodya prolifera JEL478]|eukprot:KXS13660.1 hypothetical protein M427DRAFT_366081 [Gonapodya prolifera JEL478]
MTTILATTSPSLSQSVSLLVASWSAVGAGITALLYFCAIAGLGFVTSRKWRIWRVTLALLLFCATRIATFVVRALLVSQKSPVLYITYQAILLAGTPLLLAALVESVLLWSKKVDDSTLTFVGRDGLSLSKIYLASLGWYHVLVTIVLAVMALLGVLNTYFLLTNDSNPDFQSSWRRPGYVIMEFAVWGTIVLVALLGVWRLHKPTFRDSLMRTKGYELALEQVRRGDPGGYLAQNASIGDASSLGSGDPSAYALRVEVFIGKRRILQRVLYTLFIPCGILVLARMAFAPTVVTEEQFNDPKLNEGIWLPMVAGLELIALVIFAIPSQFRFLDIEGVRLRPLRSALPS